MGARPPEVEAEDQGFVYYSRYFSGPAVPRQVGRALVPMGSISLLTIPADNGTWSVTLFGQTGDRALRALRDPDAFSRVLSACSRHAHWLDGRPITGVLPMAGVLDRRRDLAVDGRPVVTGFAAVGDAWACTNPSAGRGMSVGGYRYRSSWRSPAPRWRTTCWSCGCSRSPHQVCSRTRPGSRTASPDRSRRAATPTCWPGCDGGSRPLIRRRTKEQVAADLPPKQVQPLEVDLDPKHRQIYQRHLQRERQKVLGLIDDVDRNRFTILHSLTLLRQLSLHPD